MWQRVYGIIFQPTSRTENDRRRELILNCLLACIIVAASGSLASSIFGLITSAAHAPRLALFGPTLLWGFFIMLRLAVYYGYYRKVAYLFVAALLLLVTCPVLVWGIVLPQAMLMYALIIVTAGILLSSRVTFVITFYIMTVLIGAKFLEHAGWVVFSTEGTGATGRYSDIAIFGVIFIFFAIVAWLPNRETERLLKQVEQSAFHTDESKELNRFAEIGRLSSTLLHELSNPLTALVITIDQLQIEQEPELFHQVKETVSFMENYVRHARQQLRHNNEVMSFNVENETKLAVDSLAAKIRATGVSLDLDLAPQQILHGDNIRFHEIIANLVSNAIDAVKDKPLLERKVVVRMIRVDQTLEITIQDKGPGIAPLQLKRIFEPFYTTKPVEKGTGLGLTIAKRAVNDFNGSISVVSSRQGTSFKVILPVPPGV